MSQDPYRHSKQYPIENLPCRYPPDLSESASQAQEDYSLVYHEHDLHIYDSLGIFQEEK